MSWEVRTMRSGISCFNGPLYKKNMARFWPVWTLYGLVWLFMIPLQFLSASSRDGNAMILLSDLARNSIPRFMSIGVWISALFGLMAAMAVFSYLYTSRSACMMHALPMDRNTLFFTNYISGLSFLLLPNLAVFLLALAMELLYGCTALEQLALWLAVQSATALFFFSFAAFCAMFTGSLLALPIFYGILNCLVYVIYDLLTAVLSSFLYGAWGLGSGLEEAVGWCTPLPRLYDACVWDYVYAAETEQYASQLRSPSTVVIYAAVGVALSVIALLVYQRRHVESAGDVVSVPLVRPIFKYGVALCAGLCFGVWTPFILGLEGDLAMAATVLLWAVIGYFVAEMLLRKSFRVFRRWKGAAVMVGVLCLLFAAVELDWFGYEGRVPAAQDVASVQVYGSSSAPYDTAYSVGSLTVTQPQQIQEIIALHQAIVDHRDLQDQAGNDYLYTSFVYTLNNGQTIRRKYQSVPVFQEELGDPGTVSGAYQALLDDREYVRLMYGFDQFDESRLVEVYVDNPAGDYTGESYYLTQATGQDLEELWDAVLQDFEEGTIGVRYPIDSSPQRQANTYTADLCFIWEMETENPSASQEFSITLTPQASHTLEKLAQLGVFEEDGLVLVTHQELDS